MYKKLVVLLLIGSSLYAMEESSMLKMGKHKVNGFVTTCLEDYTGEGRKGDDEVESGEGGLRVKRDVEEPHASFYLSDKGDQDGQELGLRRRLQQQATGTRKPMTKGWHCCSCSDEFCEICWIGSGTLLSCLCWGYLASWL